jgi:outer membrane receptor protein involved in Fe transport
MQITKAVMIICVGILLLAVVPIEASSTGKLKGRVTDKHTKEPLPSAVVQIDGTSIGKLTDSDGEYIFMDISPGVYSVIARMVGKHAVTMRKVEIRGGYSTTCNFELEDSVLILGPQVVTGPGDLIDVGNVGNGDVIDQREIARLPADDIGQVLAKTPGVVNRGDGIHLWGGRHGETGMSVDDIMIRDLLADRGPKDMLINIATRDIQEVQITKGGAPAEQGNAISGFVQVTTKPPADSTTGRLAYFTDSFRTKILNKNSFNFDRVEFNLSGPEPLFTSRLLPLLGIRGFKGVSYAVSGALDKSDGYANYKQYLSEVTRREFRQRSVLGFFNLTDRMKNAYEASVKLNWQGGKGIKLALNYRGSWDDYTEFQWDYRYTPATAPVIHQQAAVYSLRWTHQLNSSTFYEIILSRFNSDYREQPGDPDHPGLGLTPDQFLPVAQYESFYDRNGNGRYDLPEPFINANSDSSVDTGNPYYTFGDNYIRQPQAPILPTPPNDPEWRGVDARYQGQPNSSALVDSILTDWNGNGVVDFYESELFVDLNGDGKWNDGDYLLRDTNGNGIYDPERGAAISVDQPEPYTDGDVNLGEPFVDVNLNGVYDRGIDIFILSPQAGFNMDLNYNSKYDGSGDPWSPGLPFKDLNGNGLYDQPNGHYDYGEPFSDLNGNGKWDAKDGFYDRGHQQWAYYQDRSASRTTIDVKINRMFGKNAHDVKSGLALDLHTLKMADLRYPNYAYDGIPDGGAWPDRGIFRDFYSRRPVSGAFFVQDKMEYGAMIGNIGIRYDFFIQSGDVKRKQISDQGAGKSVIGSQNRFSPRVGFSYPISTVAKVYFNYGHYNQLPELNMMYRRATQASSAFGIIGNENLDFEKTVQYAIGVTYKLSDSYVLDLSTYYKDIYGIINSVREGGGPTALNVYQNSDYARARGFEIKLDRRYGDFISGYGSYAYAFAYGKSSNENSNYFDDFYARAIPIQETPLDWDTRHQLTVNFDLNVPADIHPKLFGLKLPEDWGANLIWQFSSGLPFTPDKDYPGLRLMSGESPQTNSMRYPANSNVDVRMYKRFPFLGLSYTVDLWVNNLFNTKNIGRIYETTGRYNTTSKIPGANYVLEGSDIAKNPLNLGSGRNIRLGLGIEF